MQHGLWEAGGRLSLLLSVLLELSRHDGLSLLVSGASQVTPAHQTKADVLWKRESICEHKCVYVQGGGAGSSSASQTKGEEKKTGRGRNTKQQRAISGPSDVMCVWANSSSCFFKSGCRSAIPPF